MDTKGLELSVPQYLRPSFSVPTEDEEQDEPPPLLSGVSFAPAPTLPPVASLASSPPTETLHVTTLTCGNTSFEAMLSEYVALRIYDAHDVPSADPTLDVGEKRGEHTLDIELTDGCIPAEMDDFNATSRQIARILSLSDWLQEPSAIGESATSSSHNFSTVCVALSNTIVKCRAPLAFRPNEVWREYDVVKEFNEVANARYEVERTNASNVTARAAALKKMREWNNYIGLTNFSENQREKVVEVMKEGFQKARKIDEANLPLDAAPPPRVATSAPPTARVAPDSLLALEGYNDVVLRVHAKVEDAAASATDAVLLAYVGDELRGRGRAVSPALFAFLVYGALGATVRFVLHTGGADAPLAPTHALRAGALGSVHTPFALSRAPTPVLEPVLRTTPASAPESALDYVKLRRQRVEQLLDASMTKVVETHIDEAARQKAKDELESDYNDLLQRFEDEQPGALVGDNKLKKLRLRIVEYDGTGSEALRSIMRDGDALLNRENDLTFVIARDADQAYAAMLRIFRTYFKKRRRAFDSSERGRCEANDDDVKWFEAIGIEHEEAMTLVYEKRIRMSNLGETTLERMCPDAQCSPTAFDLIMTKVFGRNAPGD